MECLLKKKKGFIHTCIHISKQFISRSHGCEITIGSWDGIDNWSQINCIWHQLLYSQINCIRYQLSCYMPYSSTCLYLCLYLLNLFSWNISVTIWFWKPVDWAILWRAFLWWVWICIPTTTWPRDVCCRLWGLSSVWYSPATSKLKICHGVPLLEWWMSVIYLFQARNVEFNQIPPNEEWTEFWRDVLVS